MTGNHVDLPQGALELLVLRTLARGPEHGYALGQRIRERSAGALAVEEGSLYPALHRMERRGWVEAEWGRSERGRRAKFYALTAAGRTRLAEASATWERMTRAVGLVLEGGAS